MSLEVYSRQSKAFQYDGYKINSEMREHINAEKSSSNVHKDSTDHMMLTATELGLGSCWITYFDPEAIRAAFNLPENLVPVNILAIGYAADKPQSPDRHTQTRKALNQTVTFETL